MDKRVIAVTAFINAMVLFVAFVLPVLAESDMESGDVYAVPSTAHMIFADVKDGQVTAITEFFFDRASEQCRRGRYEFEKASLVWRDVEHADMRAWETIKATMAPDSVEILGSEHRYEVFVRDHDPCKSDPHAGENCRSAFTELGAARICFINVLPKEPATESGDWRAWFAPESPPRALKASWRREATGEYRTYQNFYAEAYYPPGMSSMVEPDRLLEKIWYEKRYLLPTKRLMFGVRADLSTYLSCVFLAEYDFSLGKELFDPDAVARLHEGIPVWKQDLSSWLLP